jgi:hypothetical protein
MLQENTNMGMNIPEQRMLTREEILEVASSSVGSPSPSFSLDPLSATSSVQPSPSLSPDLSKIGQREQGRTREDIQSSEDMMAIRQYMVERKGKQFADRDDSEVYDAFVNHMRFMNVNEVTTLGEMTWTSRADERQKAIAGNAYDIYNSLGNVFVNDGVAGAFDGIADYGRAILTSPSTYIGGLVGRLTVGSTTRAAAQAGISASTRAAVEAAKATARQQGIQQGLSKEALKTTVEMAGDKVAKEIGLAAARRTMFKQIGVAGAVDAGANTVQDYLYQSVMMEAGAQDEYSVLQSGIAALGGVVGAGVASTPYAFRGASGLLDTEANITASFARAKEENLKRLKPEMVESFKKVKTSMDDWLKSAQEGDVAIGNDRSLERQVVQALIYEDSPSSIFKMMERAGFIFETGPDAPPITAQAIQAIRDVGKEFPDAFKEIDDLFIKEVGIDLDTALNISAQALREGGQDLNQVSRQFATISGARRASANELGPDGVPMPKEDLTLLSEPQVIQYTQSVWRRMLVSHPATTAVNVQGWGTATLANTIAQLLHGGSVGTLGLMARIASPVSATAKSMSDAQLTKAARIFQAEAFQIKTLLDPITTRESFTALVGAMPKRYQTQLESAMFGGIDVTGPTRFNLARTGKALQRGSRDPQVKELQQLLKVKETGRFDEATEQAVIALQKKTGLVQTGRVGSQEWASLTAGPVVRTVEKATNKIAVASAVKLQDTYTKANTFLYELNKESLKRYGIPINELLASGRAVDITDEMYERATKVAMERAFSADLTRQGGLLGSVYRFTESLSSAPGLGFIFPFGRFVNNNLHFLLQYNPLGLFPDLYRATAKGAWKNEDFWEASLKRVVGMGALYYLAMHQRENVEQGLRWDQIENRQGDVNLVTNVAPLSFYLLGGRIFDLILKQEEVPQELLQELGGQIGTDFLSRGVTDTTDALFESIGYMANMLSDGATAEDFKKIALSLGNSFTGVASGFTRPLEPINVVGGLLQGTTDRPDRRQLSGGDKMLSEITRYTDNIFAPFLREDFGQGNAFAPTAQSIGVRTGVYDANPVSRLTGTRKELPVTNIQRMLNKVNLPEWRANERTGIPAFDALINERATRLLEPRAERLLKSARWRDANNRVRRLMVNELMSEVKKDTRDWAARGRVDERTLVEQRRWTSVNERLRTEAKKQFGLQNTSDTDLSWRQIELMRTWIEAYRNVLSATVERT